MLNVNLAKIKAHIYSHLSPVYPISERSIFGGIIHGIAYAIQLVRSGIESIRSNVFYKTAQGPQETGVRATFDMSGVSVRLVDDDWPINATGDFRLEYNFASRKLRLTGKPWVLLDREPNEYNLNNVETPAFIVFVTPSKLPAIDAIADIKLERKTTPDYLGELARNRSVLRRSGETDSELRDRCMTIGQQVSIPAIRKQLQWLLKTDNFIVQEYREQWESWPIPGASFIGYSSIPGTKPIGRMQEQYFGSYACEKSMNNYRYVIYLPAGVGSGVTNQEILDVCNSISASGVVVEIERVLS